MIETLERAESRPAESSDENPPEIEREEASDETTEHDQLGRRGFCTYLLLTPPALLLVSKQVGAKSVSQEPLLVYPPLKIEGAESLVPGSSLYFNYPSRSDAAILVRADDGNYYAYGQKCSHLGCSIYYDRSKRCLECPCHKGTYAVQTGSVLLGPPPRPLAQIFLQMRGGGEVWATGRGFFSSESDAYAKT